ncbi:MAG TPA: DUF6647 family protein [Burkholderiales bacterium]|nr:DUF6647 family protein [Burkholderiales bacterium]
MDGGSLQSLMVELFTAIQMLAGYPMPAELPEIHRAPAAVMQQKICGHPCRVKAFYHPQWGVYVDDSLDVFHDPFDRSILLHELVHHLQRVTGRFDSVSGSCLRKNAEELEAYEIQNRYLSWENAGKRALAVGAPATCKDEAN